MADKQTRMKQILELLANNDSESIKNIASYLSVSEMTARRDISYLEKSKFVNVFFGGVSLNENKRDSIKNFRYSPYFFDDANSIFLNEKKHIAAYAASLIEAFDAIAIDNGTTCRYIIDELHEPINCILYTYSMEVLSRAININSENLRLFCFGGLYHNDLKMFESFDVIEMIKKTHINKLFFGAVGVSTAYGLSCAQRYEIDIRRALMSVSDQIIVLADSSKIGKTWFLQYGDISDIDLLITDSRVTKKQYDDIKSCGINIKVV